MSFRSRNDAVNRREFLTTTGTGLAAAAALPVTGAWSAASDSPAKIGAINEELRPLSPAGAKKKIPIGVFDPVYEHLSLDEMLDKVSALGLEAMEIGTGGYPNNHHCPLDELVQDKTRAKAWQKKFEDKGLRVATLSVMGIPFIPTPSTRRKTSTLFAKRFCWRKCWT
jgi:hypothetical protein